MWICYRAYTELVPTAVDKISTDAARRAVRLREWAELLVLPVVGGIEQRVAELRLSPVERMMIAEDDHRVARVDLEHVGDRERVLGLDATERRVFRRTPQVSKHTATVTYRYYFSTVAERM